MRKHSCMVRVGVRNDKSVYVSSEAGGRQRVRTYAAARSKGTPCVWGEPRSPGVAADVLALRLCSGEGKERENM